MNIILLICLILLFLGRLEKGYRLFLDSSIILGSIILYFYIYYFILSVLIIFNFDNILKGIKFIIDKIPITSKFYTLYITKIKNNISVFFEIILISFIAIMFFIQKKFELIDVNFFQYDINAKIGFAITIVTLYAVYLAFLQYLSSDLKFDLYLGRSKIEGALKSYPIYYLIQTKTFIFMLFFIVIFPVISNQEFLNHGNIKYSENLNILWKIICILLVIMYVSIIKMCIEISKIAFHIRIQLDYNKKIKINLNIQKEYTDLFWMIYNDKNKYLDIFIEKIRDDFNKLNDEEYSEFVKNIFEKEYLNSYNLGYTISKTIRLDYKIPFTIQCKNFFLSIFNKNGKIKNTFQNKNIEFLSDRIDNFYHFLSAFILKKWKLLKNYEKYIPFPIWQQLVNQDLENINEIVKFNSPIFLDSEYIKHKQYDNGVEEKLFQFLIDKEDADMTDIIELIKKEIKCIDSEKSYEYIFLNYKLKKILKKYEKEEILFSLPKFKNLRNRRNENGEYYDYENSMLYSKICFEYLFNFGRLLDFSNNQKIKNIILSMNEEYRLAFMLFQLLYTDSVQFDQNIEFYDCEIREIIENNDMYHDYLFEQAKNIILKTNISHRITSKFLDLLWKTRFDVISDMKWFNQFGTLHLMSNFKILYVQNLLVCRQYPESSRFDFVNSVFNEDSILEISYLCKSYLLNTSVISSVFEKDTYYMSKNKLQKSFEYILGSGNVNFSIIIEDLHVLGLLHLEWLFKTTLSIYKTSIDYNSRTFLETSQYREFSTGKIQFYILKIIDDQYKSIYNEKFRYTLMNYINSDNKTIEEYVTSICDKVSNQYKISVLEKEKIIFKLKKLVL